MNDLVRAISTVNPDDPEQDTGLQRDTDKLAGDGDQFGDEDEKDEKDKNKNANGEKRDKKASKRAGSCT